MESVDYLTKEVSRLLGDVRGKRILELGIARESLCSDLVARGATTILVEESREKLTALRKTQELSEIKFEARQSEFADLAFCPAESVDIAVSIIALSGVKDLARVFRQIHRVLKIQGTLVFGLVHPVAILLSNSPMNPQVTSYGSKEPLESEGLNLNFPVPLPKMITSFSFGDTFSLLKRAGFSIDQILEMGNSGPNKTTSRPDVLVLKAHK